MPVEQWWTFNRIRKQLAKEVILISRMIIKYKKAIITNWLFDIPGPFWLTWPSCEIGQVYFYPTWPICEIGQVYF